MVFVCVRGRWGGWSCPSDMCCVYLRGELGRSGTQTWVGKRTNLFSTGGPSAYEIWVVGDDITHAHPLYFSVRKEGPLPHTLAWLSLSVKGPAFFMFKQNRKNKCHVIQD